MALARRGAFALSFSMHGELVILGLFSVATLVALLTRWLKVPYTVALVVAGLALGWVHIPGFSPPHLTKELLYTIFLPGLVFEAAFHLELKKYWENKIAIHALAIPGVALTIGVTALLLELPVQALGLVAGFSLKYALLFAALISAIDPIAVVALFRGLGAPKRLVVLIEAESLLNDGTAVVFFTLSLAMVSGDGYSPLHAALDFARMLGLGTLLGIAIGLLTSRVARYAQDPMLEIMLTTLAAYGSFVLAEQLHLSGIIATVAAGLVCGQRSARGEASPKARIALQSFWEYVAFALNSLVFLLIGFEVHSAALLGSWRLILAAYLAVLLGRALLVYLVTFLLRTTREALPWSWSALLTWGGLRGGLSMVLVLALPGGFPFRESLVTMTFGVVLLSLLVQGLSIERLLRKLGLERQSDAA